jgi:AcrR family transcriptional regulator
MSLIMAGEARSGRSLEAMPRLSEQRRAVLDETMREVIYHAAVDVVTDYGAAGLTMDRVAAAAQVAKGSLYNYFRDKQGLLRFVYEKSYEPIGRRVREIAGSDKAAAEKLEAIARTYFEYVDSHQRLFDFLLNDAVVRGRLKSEQDSLRSHAIEELTEIVEEGILAGDFRPANAERVAEMLLGAVRQMAERQLATGRLEPVEETVGALVGVFLDGIASRK